MAVTIEPLGRGRDDLVDARLAAIVTDPDLAAANSFRAAEYDLGHDHEQQAASLGRVRALRDDGALVIPGHDPDVFAALPTVLS